ncbi:MULTISPECIES: hypothetical protein [Pseudomonas]|uniref:hypothetical protein n=1 Tax=Pseudomonas TaxID=286 RepID=UPI000C32346E|nr:MULTISPECIES: hypothetical protein [Pseudomonas]PWD01940.1 hypothetical protein CX658_18450 [Pseudomonas amygdali pv. lachrymans]WNZ87585.1 hypothetical protein QOM10_30325 [Pseudomonas sp. P108]
MHPAIGQLSNGQFYSYINGHSEEPFFGTLEEVEVAMGLREPIVTTPSFAPAEQVDPAPAKSYTVTLTFQYPAWDEVNGIRYPDIRADSKSHANIIARRLACNDGHLGGGKGRLTFTATEL